MCGVVHGGIIARAVGLRGRPERRRRHLRLVRRALRAAGVPRRGRASAASALHEHLTELARASSAVGEHGLVALDWHSGNRSVLVDHELSGADRRPDAGHPRRRTSTARCSRRPRSARARSSRRSRRPGVAGAASSSSPAACCKNPFADADLRRRDAAPAEPDRLRAGPGARLGHPRRGRRRLLPRHRRRRRRRWARCERDVYLPDPDRRRTPTTRSTPSTRRCTTTSAAAATTCAPPAAHPQRGAGAGR